MTSACTDRAIVPIRKRRRPRVYVEPAFWSDKHLAALSIRLSHGQFWQSPSFPSTSTIEQLLQCVSGETDADTTGISPANEYLYRAFNRFFELEKFGHSAGVHSIQWAIKYVLSIMAPTISNRYSPYSEEHCGHGDQEGEDISTRHYSEAYDLIHDIYGARRWHSVVTIRKDEVPFVVLAEVEGFGFFEEVAYLVSIAQHIFQTSSGAITATSPVLISVISHYVRIVASTLSRQFIEYYQTTSASNFKSHRPSADCVILREYHFLRQTDRKHFLLDVYAILKLGIRIAAER